MAEFVVLFLQITHEPFLQFISHGVIKFCIQHTKTTIIYDFGLEVQLDSLSFNYPKVIFLLTLNFVYM